MLEDCLQLVARTADLELRVQAGLVRQNYHCIGVSKLRNKGKEENMNLLSLSPLIRARISSSQPLYVLPMFGVPEAICR